jgi:hypothetical protein
MAHWWFFLLVFLSGTVRCGHFASQNLIFYVILESSGDHFGTPEKQSLALHLHCLSVLCEARVMAGFDF